MLGGPKLQKGGEKWSEQKKEKKEGYLTVVSFVIILLAIHLLSPLLKRQQADMLYT